MLRPDNHDFDPFDWPPPERLQPLEEEWEGLPRWLIAVLALSGAVILAIAFAKVTDHVGGEDAPQFQEEAIAP